MTIQEMFSNAVWVGTEKDGFYILRGKFNISNIAYAKLRVVGLGFFHCYINGKRVGDDLFQPLNSEFEYRNDVAESQWFSGFRLYVPEYDVTDLLVDGENVISIHFGGGWYGVDGWYSKGYGYNNAKAIWRIFGEDVNGTFDYGSSMEDRIAESFITDYKFDHKPIEYHDYNLYKDDCLSLEYDDSDWKNAVAVSSVNTNYVFSDCPMDRVIKTVKPKQILRNGDVVIYDCGINTTGYPVLHIRAKKGESVKVVFSEEIDEQGLLHEKFTHKQIFEIVSDGKEREIKPLFLWFGFRYFSVYGSAEVKCVEIIHANVGKASSFTCDNQTLNWIHDAYVNSQLTNMHCGVPSDCPHLEKRGYTGDGQITARAAMSVLNAKSFYKKWIRDIADIQDKNTGRIFNTAPYVVSSGGGPGGWGCAIIKVPYEYYLAYGEKDILEEYYPYMVKYLGYLESISSNDLVLKDTTDKPNQWCLGDWGTVDLVTISPPFVNTYFYIKSLEMMIEIAMAMGKNNDIEKYRCLINRKKAMLERVYGTGVDGNFFGCKQGANAFAVDIGIGNEKTYPNLVKYYQELQELDTGIFGTEVVIRTLFENGDGDLAISLLTSTKNHSFSEMIKQGATTLWEFMPNSKMERSHNHPMFGALVSSFYDYLLGIKGDVGYNSVVIEPKLVKKINEVVGYKTVNNGKIEVSYKKTDCSVTFNVVIPKNIDAVFIYEGKTFKLKERKNELFFNKLKNFKS